MDARRSYQVKLEFFEGPLDLLLFLIRKKKIDIHDIPIATITKEYLEYLNHREKINLDREAEFLFIAALLIYIKSQVLLPREEPPREEDPRQLLVDRLLDYKKIKTACNILKKQEEEESKKWKRVSLPSTSGEEEMDLEDISLFDLAQSFFLLMKRKEKENIQVIRGKEYTIEEKMKEIVSCLKKNKVLDFFEYFSQQQSIEEALVSFFSLLELIQTGMVMAVQERLFCSIKVWLQKDSAPQVSS
ncbi:MAG: segregation and condensation protein A [Candidatus Aminicenantes bacterium]